MDMKRMGMAASLAGGGQPQQPAQPQVGQEQEAPDLDAKIMEMHAAILKLSAQMDALLGEGQPAQPAEPPQGAAGAVQ